ncbi:hypothetical protein [Rhodococcus zopfii]|uniref:hypothetical protein n=1 Tax=Rhodococcus zopfii TaxID=43772 RepID=UPI000AFCC7A5|nr:hypothetical protein [Rhodococcus zopfii]
MTSKLALVGALALTATVAAGCSSTGDSVTCTEFTAQSMSEQQTTLQDLLREHDLVVLDIGNIQGVTDSVTSFCSKSGNSDAPVNEAVDWDSGTW